MACNYTAKSGIIISEDSGKPTTAEKLAKHTTVLANVALIYFILLFYRRVIFLSTDAVSNMR